MAEHKDPLSRTDEEERELWVAHAMRGVRGWVPKGNQDPMFGLNRDGPSRMTMPPPKPTLWDRLVAAWGAFKEGSRG